MNIHFIARIKLFSCNVKDRMKLSDSEGESITTQYIVGTHMDDLMQIYNGRTIIRGSVNIVHLLNTQEESLLKNNQDFYVNEPASFGEKISSGKIIVNGNSFVLSDLTLRYWMKNIDQVMPYKFLTTY